MNEKPDLLNDKDIAQRLGFSRSWVRQERFRRRRGQHHALSIDPIFVGTKPRYRTEEFDAWVAQLKAPKPADGN